MGEPQEHQPARPTPPQGAVGRFFGQRHVAFWTIVAGVAAVVTLVLPLVKNDAEAGPEPGPTTTPSAPATTAPTASPTTSAAGTPPADPTTGSPAGPDDDRTGSARPSKEPDRQPKQLPRSAVPRQLVGTWSGGSQGETAGKSYTFTARGSVTFRNSVAGLQLVGTTVVRGDRLTLYFPGVEPQPFRWSTDSYSLEGFSFSNLYLDGYTYVREN